MTQTFAHIGLAGAIGLPLLGALTFFVRRESPAWLVGLAALLTGGSTALLLLPAVTPFSLALGDWTPPLGIAYGVDGSSTLMLAVTLAVYLAGTLYALSEDPPSGYFWAAWFMLWSGLNVLYLSTDLFNLYVGLELVSLAAVILIVQGGTRALVPAARYAFVAAVGSLLFLLGVALTYGALGRLDGVSLTVQEGDLLLPLGVAFGCMLAGMGMKSALFPFHFWLPPAHAEAPSAASAVLSALVVKGSFFVLVRLSEWGLVDGGMQGWVLATTATGGAAVLWGSLQALREPRLKPIIAYSTVAQVGYLFLGIPLMLQGPEGVRAVLTYVVAHGLAKAALFLGAGACKQAAGGDALRELRGYGLFLPLVGLSMVLAGWTLSGFGPGGGEAAKGLVEDVAMAGEWAWLASAFQWGRWLTLAYLLRVVWFLGVPSGAGGVRPARAPSLGMQLPALALGVLGFGLGFVIDG